MAQSYTVAYYIAADGEAPFIQWLESLRDFGTIQRIRNRIDRFEMGNLGDHHPIKGMHGLYEARLFFGPGYRLYFAMEENRIILLLCGGVKGSQHRDIARAIAYYREYQGE